MQTKINKLIERYCDKCEEEDKKRVAKYECIVCGAGHCKVCESYNFGECTFCEPPYLIKIKRK